MSESTVETVQLYHCPRCNEDRPKKDFYKDKTRIPDIRTPCKICEKNKKETINLISNTVEDGLTVLNDIDLLYPEKQYFTTLISGSTKSGKTTLINHIASKIYKQYDLMILFSSNCHIDNYDFFHKHGIVFDTFNEKVIKLLHYIQKKTKNKFSFLVFLDDEVNSKYDATLKMLMTTLRNSHFTTFISLQSHILLNKVSRNNAQRVICMKLNSSEEIREFIEKMLLGCIKIPDALRTKHHKMEYLHNFYNKMTENYQSIIVDNLENKNYKFKVSI